jgi:arylsulfatase A
MRQGKWKLVVAPGSGGWSKPKDKDAKADGLPAMQLYDMEVDLGETNNRINDYPEKAQALLALLTEQVEKGRSTAGSVLKNDVDVKINKMTK